MSRHHHQQRGRGVGREEANPNDIPSFINTQGSSNKGNQNRHNNHYPNGNAFRHQNGSNNRNHYSNNNQNGFAPENLAHFGDPNGKQVRFAAPQNSFENQGQFNNDNPYQSGGRSGKSRHRKNGQQDFVAIVQPHGKSSTRPPWTNQVVPESETKHPTLEVGNPSDHISAASENPVRSTPAAAAAPFGGTPTGPRGNHRGRSPNHPNQNRHQARPSPDGTGPWHQHVPETDSDGDAIMCDCAGALPMCVVREFYKLRAEVAALRRRVRSCENRAQSGGRNIPTVGLVDDEDEWLL